MNYLKSCCLICAMLMAACSSENAKNNQTGERTNQHKLVELADLLRSFPKPPVKIAELKPHSTQYPFAVEAVNMGELLIIPGVQIAGEGGGDSSGKVVAYEKKVATDGGAVLCDNGKIKEISAAEFNALKLPAPLK